jgi:hypothetical protein
LIFAGGPLVFAMEQAAGVAVPVSLLKFSRAAASTSPARLVQKDTSQDYCQQRRRSIPQKLRYNGGDSGNSLDKRKKGRTE